MDDEIAGINDSVREAERMAAEMDLFIMEEEMNVYYFYQYHVGPYMYQLVEPAPSTVICSRDQVILKTSH